MTVSLWLFGVQVMCFTIGPTEAETEDDGGRDLGYTTASPVGFVAAFEVPDGMPIPSRNNGWGDEGN